MSTARAAFRHPPRGGLYFHIQRARGRGGGGMDYRKLADNVHWLGGPIFGFYLAGAARPTLIELGTSQVIPHLAKAAEKLLGGFRPSRLVCMHSHYDHAGGAARLKRMFPDAELCGSAAAGAVLADPDAAATFSQSMEKIHLNPAFKLVFQDADEEVFWNPTALDRVVREGDTLPLDDGSALRVLETPGHSDCSISLFHEPTRALFVSDAVGVPFPSGRIWVTAFSNLDQYRRGVERLIALEPEHLCIGHVPPFSGDRARRWLERTLKVTGTFFDHLRALHAELGDVRAVVHSLVREYETDMPFIQANVFKWGCWEMAKQVAAENGETPDRRE